MPTDPAESDQRPFKRPTIAADRKRLRLTEIEKQIHDLRLSTDPPMPWGVLARRVGRDRQNCKRFFKNAEEKLPKLGQTRPNPRSLQARDPEKYVAVMEGLSHPDTKENSVAAIAARVGVSRGVVESVDHELETERFPVKVEMRKVTTDQLLTSWGTAASNALEAMTPEKYEQASLYQLATAAGIATDKLLLLRGLPTQIVRTEKDRAHLDVLAVALDTELVRRGYKVETDAATGMVDVSCDHPWRAEE